MDGRSTSGEQAVNHITSYDAERNWREWLYGFLKISCNPPRFVVVLIGRLKYSGVVNRGIPVRITWFLAPSYPVSDVISAKFFFFSCGSTGGNHTATGASRLHLS
jgi:hypothetical protein